MPAAASANQTDLNSARRNAGYLNCISILGIAQIKELANGRAIAEDHLVACGSAPPGRPSGRPDGVSDADFTGRPL
jgi:hypothetical protein